MPSLFGDAAPHEILRVLTYHPQNFDDSVLSISADRNVADLNPLPTSPTLGNLDFPVELLDVILRLSDLRTVSTFRLLNRRARTVVDTSFSYQFILLHVPHVVAALARTGIASHFTVDDVFSGLCTPKCHTCEDFGCFLWIPKCIRCCFTCLRDDSLTMPVEECDVKVSFGMAENVVLDAPIMATLPGEYTLQHKPYRTVRHLLSQDNALVAASIAHQKCQTFERRVFRSGRQRAITESRMKARSGDILMQIDDSEDDPTRFMTAIPFPYFDPKSRTTHVGLVCKGCKAQKACFQDRMYTEDGVFAHLEGCMEAQALWRAHRESHRPTP